MDNNLANNSSLNPNAAPFQPFIPLQIQHTVNILNNYNSYHYNHQRNQTQNQQRIILSQNNNYRAQNQQNNVDRNYYNHIIHNSNDTIYYNVLTINIPQKKDNKKSNKSQTYQPSNDKNNNNNNNETDLLHLLIVGYCHNIEGIKMHMIPNDLFVICMKFYGYDIKVIGLNKNKIGFAVCNYTTQKTIYYMPHSTHNSKSMNPIISTVRNIKLPFHIINAYNIKYATNEEDKINEFNRFNVLFLQKVGLYACTDEFSTVVFNDNCAFELIIPQKPQLSNFISSKTNPSVYSSKYGLLISINACDALLSFSLKTWKWTVIERKDLMFSGNGMCLLNKENKLFLHQCDTQRYRCVYYYLYDMNTSMFETVPISPYLCSNPSFCCDDTIHPRIYALSRNNYYTGCVSYFDLNKFKWINNALPKHKGMNQIWFGNDKNILYGICKNIIFMLDLRVGKEWKQVFSFRTFMEYNTFLKL